MSFKPQPKGFSTSAIHAGQSANQWSHRNVVPSIVTSTTFKQDGPAEFKVQRINQFLIPLLFYEQFYMRTIHFYHNESR